MKQKIEDALPKKVELVIEDKKYVYVRKDVDDTLKERFEIRKKIQSMGKAIYESIKNEDLKYLAGELMSKNEDWVLNHRDTEGAEIILRQGFSDNQLIFIKNLQNKLENVAEKLRKRNPYPKDVFVSKMGKFGRKVWNCCCDELEEMLKGD